MKKLGALLLLLLLLTGCGSKPPQGKYLCTTGIVSAIQIEVKGKTITTTNLLNGSSVDRKMRGTGPIYKMNNGNYLYWDGSSFGVSQTEVFSNLMICRK